MVRCTASMVALVRVLQRTHTLPSLKELELNPAESILKMCPSPFFAERRVPSLKVLRVRHSGPLASLLVMNLAPHLQEVSLEFRPGYCVSSPRPHALRQPLLLLGLAEHTLTYVELGVGSTSCSLKKLMKVISVHLPVSVLTHA